MSVELPYSSKTGQITAGSNGRYMEMKLYGAVGKFCIGDGSQI
jgi:hypothetical protein